MHINRRHTPHCTNRGQKHPERCECPIRIEDKELEIREALPTRNWHEAQRMLRQRKNKTHVLEQTVSAVVDLLKKRSVETDTLVLDKFGSAGLPIFDGSRLGFYVPVPTKTALNVPLITVDETKSRYLSNLDDTTENGGERRKLSDDTLKKYERLLNDWRNYCMKHAVVYLKDFTQEHVRAFRRTWNDDPKKWSFVKKNERLRSVFGYFVDEKLIEKNPVGSVEPPEQNPNSAEIKCFTPDEWNRVLSACDHIDPRGPESHRERTRAFLLVMRYTGLRISDVMALERRRLNNGILDLTAIKNRKQVWLPLPTEVTDALAKLPINGRYFFWTGNGLLKSAISDIRRPLSKVFKTANVKLNPHMFRHTFISELLEKGTHPNDVAEIVGDTVEMIYKHYKHSIPKWRDRIMDAVKKTWTEPADSRVDSAATAN